jgi:hypothetical protein
MNPELKPMDAALEQALAEIRDEAIDPAVVEAAAARVWARLAEARRADASHIRSCGDFQALIPELRAGRLSEARALLVKDHIHQCVACRHVFEGKVVTMPAPVAVRRSSHTTRWVAGAVAAAAAVVLVYVAYDQYGGRTGHAIVQSVDGTLLVVSADGIHPLLKGQELPRSGEIRTERDSDAVLQLQDGSQVEMRERSSLFATASGRDVTLHLGRGSVIVQAAHRSSGHLYVDTVDCRVAVTGTLFGVTAGSKGSRVSVLQGEVHVTQDNREQVLHPGDQSVSNAAVEKVPMRDEVSWSRNRDQLLKQVSELTKSLAAVHLPALRYSSKLAGQLPAGTKLFISIPNLAQYLADAQAVLSKKLADDPQLNAWWTGRGSHINAILEIVRGGSEYLGDEIDLVGGGNQAPVMVAEQRKDGFAEFLHKKGVPFDVETRNGVLLFGPEKSAVEGVASQLGSGFQNTPLYGHIADAYREGAGLLICADLSMAGTPMPLAGARYFIAQQKQAEGQDMASATLGFDGPRTGIAAWLADPSPMGSLEYVSADATIVAAFAVKDPTAIIDAALAARRGSSFSDAQKAVAEDGQQAGLDVHRDLGPSLGGEFAIAMDGSVMPVPSWKLVAEVYDPVRFQATLQKIIDAHSREMVKAGGKPLRSGQETLEGRTYYMVGAPDGGPLLEAHYTFDSGYLVAGPTRALVVRALQMKTAGTSIKHSDRFLQLAPRDHHLNFSAVIYQNLGSTIAPLAGLIGAFAPPGAAGRGNPLANLGDMKPSLYAVYGEPDRITMSANGNILGSALSGLMSGNILGMTGIPLPMAQFHGTGSR